MEDLANYYKSYQVGESCIDLLDNFDNGCVRQNLPNNIGNIDVINVNNIDNNIDTPNLKNKLDQLNNEYNIIYNKLLEYYDENFINNIIQNKEIRNHQTKKILIEFVNILEKKEEIDKKSDDLLINKICDLSNEHNISNFEELKKNNKKILYLQNLLVNANNKINILEKNLLESKIINLQYEGLIVSKYHKHHKTNITDLIKKSKYAFVFETGQIYNNFGFCFNPFKYYKINALNIMFYDEQHNNIFCLTKHNHSYANYGEINDLFKLFFFEIFLKITNNINIIYINTSAENTSMLNKAFKNNPCCYQVIFNIKHVLTQFIHSFHTANIMMQYDLCPMKANLDTIKRFIFENYNFDLCQSKNIYDGEVLKKINGNDELPK